MRYGLLFATVLSLLAALNAAQAQDENKPDGLKALDHFVGVWNTEVMSKSDDAKRSVRESTARTLKNRFILGKEVSQPDGVKSLWLMTFDAKTNSYPFWMFNSRDLLGGEWSSTWDEATKTFTGKATDTPKGWTSSGINRFSDKNTDHVSFWMKDETGKQMFEGEAKKTRQPDANSEKVIATWSKVEKPAVPLPPELKALERLVGSWDTVAISKPAEWTPKEIRTTSKVTRKWVLDGRFLQDTSEGSDGQESFSLMTFDPQMKKYRSWWFNSEGNRNKAVGERNEETESMAFRAELDDGLVARSSVRFIDKDRHIWKVEVKDGNDKLYFDTEWTVTRRKK